MHAVILAGGRGTRFWPRSRARTPKQLLNILGDEKNGKGTMLQQTVQRLAPVFSTRNFWVVTNRDQAGAVRKNAPRIPGEQILAEPMGRNTAAAIGLAAIHLLKKNGGDAVMAVLPADHYVGEPRRYQKIVRAALELAAQGPHLVTLGIVPTFAESGYGYIERGAPGDPITGQPVFRVTRFTEKPGTEQAAEYLASGKYLWNAGMFFWRVSTFLAALEHFLPKTHSALMKIAATIGTSRYEGTLRRLYPKLENISVDFAVMEPATVSPASGRPRPSTGVFVIPVDVGWSDIGTWSAVYDLLAKSPGANVSAGPLGAIDASGNFFWSPKKFVGAIGVKDLIVVETDDALLLCSRSRAQDVAKLVKLLEEKKLNNLLWSPHSSTPK